MCAAHVLVIEHHAMCPGYWLDGNTVELCEIELGRRWVLQWRKKTQLEQLHSISSTNSMTELEQQCDKLGIIV